MQLIPIRSAIDYFELKNIEGPKPKKQDNSAKVLARFVMNYGHPCILGIAPNVNCEKVSYRDISFTEYIFHNNARMLVHAPCSPEFYDAKGAYMEAFSSKSAYSLFFGSTTPESVSMRTVMEIIALFDLTAAELRLISTKPCTLESEGFREPLYDVLAHLPTNNDIAKKIEEVHRKVKTASVPARIIKAKRMMYIDVIHAFRAMGTDPYEAIVAIVKKDNEWFAKIVPGETDSRAFDMKPLQSYLLEILDPPKPKAEKAPPANAEAHAATETAGSTIVSDSTLAEVTAVLTPEPELSVEAAAPSSEVKMDIPEASNGTSSLFAVTLQARVCVPCDADSWDNDNPNRNEPGYKWETCSDERCKEIADKLTKMELTVMSIAMIKNFVEAELQYPCRAKLTICGKEFKLGIQM